MKRNLFLPILFLLCMVSCKKNLKTIIAETEDATFIIYTFDEYGSPSGSGSGFFIDKEGTGITNYHVLDESVKAILKTKEGQIYEIDKVTASDKQWDIVKFSTKHDPSEKFAYLDFSRRKAENGDRIYNISAPLGLEQTISEGIVSSLRQDSHGEIIQITAPISPGSSGSASAVASTRIVLYMDFPRCFALLLRELNIGGSPEISRVRQVGGIAVRKVAALLPAHMAVGVGHIAAAAVPPPLFARFAAVDHRIRAFRVRSRPRRVAVDIKKHAAFGRALDPSFLAHDPPAAAVVGGVITVHAVVA